MANGIRYILRQYLISDQDGATVVVDTESELPIEPPIPTDLARTHKAFAPDMRFMTDDEIENYINRDYADDDCDEGVLYDDDAGC